jgi:hypothetical protein
MAIPEIVQTKINSMKASLEAIYPPYNLKRLSTGYASSQDAYNDTTINSYVYSDNLNDFTIGDTSYTDKTLSSTFNGGELWYHVFSEIQDDLGYAVQISGLGQIVDTYFGTTTYQIKLSTPQIDLGKACTETSPADETIYYVTDNTFPIDSIVYTNSELNRVLNGNNLYYLVFNTSDVSYNIYIRIDGSGVIRDSGQCK